VVYHIGSGFMCAAHFVCVKHVLRAFATQLYGYIFAKQKPILLEFPASINSRNERSPFAHSSRPAQHPLKVFALPAQLTRSTHLSKALSGSDFTPYAARLSSKLHKRKMLSIKGDESAKCGVLTPALIFFVLSILLLMN
jgi:hypothetical protein